MKGRVLVIAGSDSGGGAGIQADIKTITALGGYAATAITALTAQNTMGVFSVHQLPASFVAEQIGLVLDDIGADCIKVGMLQRAEIVTAVADVLENRAGDIPIVVDPVMVAKGGSALLDEGSVEALKQRLIPLADLITPNLPEAEALSGDVMGNDAGAMLRKLADLGAGAVMLKGGHMPGGTVVDRLWTGAGEVEAFESPRIETTNTHGTGCTLASAIAVGIAQGMELRRAVVRARRYLLEAIRTAPGYGHGHGPLNHAHTIRRFELE